MPYYTDTLQSLVINNLQENAGDDGQPIDTRYNDSWILRCASQAQHDLVYDEKIVFARVALSGIDGIVNEFAYPTPPAGISSFSEMVGAEWDNDGTINLEWLKLVKADLGWIRNINRYHYFNEPDGGVSHWFANRGKDNPGFAIARTPMKTTTLYGVFVADTAPITASTTVAQVLLANQFTELWVNLICYKLTRRSNRPASAGFKDDVDSALAKIRASQNSAENGFFTVSPSFDSWGD